MKFCLVEFELLMELRDIVVGCRKMKYCCRCWFNGDEEEDESGVIMFGSGSGYEEKEGVV